jgi:hypothetical protein
MQVVASARRGRDHGAKSCRHKHFYGRTFAKEGKQKLRDKDGAWHSVAAVMVMGVVNVG